MFSYEFSVAVRRDGLCRDAGNFDSRVTLDGIASTSLHTEDEYSASSVCKGGDIGNEVTDPPF